MACLCSAVWAQAPQGEAVDWESVRQAERGVMRGLVSAGALSASEAEKAGALPMSETVRLLDEMSSRSYLPVAEREKIRLGLGEVLGRQLDATPTDQRPKLATSIRLGVADYYRSQGDARAVPLYETMIAEFEAIEKKKPGSFADWWIVPLAHLAFFYEEQNQYLQAAQTWGRWKDVPTGDEWQADWRIPAARAYIKAGQPEVAQQLYDEVPQYGYGAYPALALYEQALPLIRKGELAQAYALMSQPLKLTGDKNSGIVAQNAWLADLAYRQGDIEGAMQHAKLALDSGQGLSLDWVRNLHQMAKGVYTKAGGWKNQPIQTDTKEVVFQSNPSQPDKPLYARFRIKTYGDTSITASVDNPNIQARVLPVNSWQREGQNAREEEMEVIIQSNSLQPFTDVPLVLSSAKRGQITVRVSLIDKSA